MPWIHIVITYLLEVHRRTIKSKMNQGKLAQRRARTSQLKTAWQNLSIPILL